MSDPVKNVEIEDVLSSIRRLVSEDATPKPASAEPSAAEPDEAESETNVKLVLTPDFRVVDDAPANENSEINQAVGAVLEDQENSAEDIRQETLESRIAELEVTLGAQPGNWEPDGSGFSEDVDAEQTIDVPPADWVAGISEETATAEQEFEAAVSHSQPEYTAQFDPSEIHSYTPVSDDPDRSESREHPDDFLADEAFLDEEALRDMVSEIVRHELQGALGERITRNVRKLVRREINRVLANQDFE